MDESIGSSRQGKQNGWPTKAIYTTSSKTYRVWIVVDVNISRDEGRRGALENRNGKCSVSGGTRKMWMGRMRGPLIGVKSKSVGSALALPCLSPLGSGVYFRCLG